MGFSFLDTGRMPAEGDRPMKKIALFLAVALFSFSVAADEKRFAVPLDDSPVMGPSGAPVTIIEFLDFQ